MLGKHREWGDTEDNHSGYEQREPGEDFAADDLVVPGVACFFHDFGNDAHDDLADDEVGEKSGDENEEEQ